MKKQPEKFLKSFINPKVRKPLRDYLGEPDGIPFTMAHAFQGVANSAGGDVSCSRDGCGYVEAVMDAIPGALASKVDLTYTFVEFETYIEKRRNSPKVTRVVKSNDILAFDPDPEHKAQAVRELMALVGHELFTKPIPPTRRLGRSHNKTAVKPQGPRPSRANRSNPFIRSGTGRSRTTVAAA